VFKRDRTAFVRGRSTRMNDLEDWLNLYQSAVSFVCFVGPHLIDSLSDEALIASVEAAVEAGKASIDELYSVDEELLEGGDEDEDDDEDMFNTELVEEIE
jgi:hypothetical protein